MAAFILNVEIFFEIIGTLLQVFQEQVVAVPVYDGVVVSSEGLGQLVELQCTYFKGDLYHIVSGLGDKGPQQPAVVALHDLGHLTEGIIADPGGYHQDGPGFPKKGRIDEDPDNVLETVVAQHPPLHVQNGKKVGFVPGEELQDIQPGRFRGDRESFQVVSELLDLFVRFKTAQVVFGQQPQKESVLDDRHMGMGGLFKELYDLVEGFRKLKNRDVRY